MHVAIVGDIHGRFVRVHEWLDRLEGTLGASIDHVFAVGDVEAYADPTRHRERAARRAMAPEFASFADGTRDAKRTIDFIAGNNEDFATLDAYRDGHVFAGGVRYLGRAGLKSFGGMRVAWLSGIFAPRFVDTAIEPPDTADHRKQAGYFRRAELDALAAARDVDIMLVHEWPRGLVARARAEKHGIHRALRAYRFPWIGNAHTRGLVEQIAPQWLFCGHSHIALATTIEHGDGRETRVACLDQAARADGAIFWFEWFDGAVRRAGWGVDAKPAWRAGEPWNEALTPAVGDEGASSEETDAPTEKRPRGRKKI